MSETGASKAIRALEQMWAKVDAIRAANVPASGSPPEGSFTIHEYAERYSLPYATAASQLRRLAAKNVIQTGVFSGVSSGGKLAQLRYYWAE